VREKMRRKIGDYYPLWIEFVFLFLIFSSFYIAIATYPNLPEKFPIHFGFSGEPDAWRLKSWGHVLLLPLVQTGVYIILTVISLIISKAEDLRKLHLSDDIDESIDDKGIEEIRKTLIQVFLSVKGIIVAFFTYLCYMSTQVALGQKKELSLWIWVFLAFVFVPAGWMIFSNKRIARGAESRRSKKIMSSCLRCKQSGDMVGRDILCELDKTLHDLHDTCERFEEK
jgi:uncharacterized membrane protein